LSATAKVKTTLGILRGIVIVFDLTLDNLRKNQLWGHVINAVTLTGISKGMLGLTNRNNVLQKSISSFRIFEIFSYNFYLNSLFRMTINYFKKI